MVTSYRNSPPPEKGRSKKLRADVSHDVNNVLPFDVDEPEPAGGPDARAITWFVRLIFARSDCDYPAVRRAIRQLRKYDVGVVCLDPQRRGGRP